MLKHIERLREKPEHVRKSVAFFTSLGITMIIFLFWFASMTITSTPANRPQAKVDNPVSSLSASVSGFFTYFKELFTGGKKITDTEGQAEVDVVPGKR